SPAGTTVRYVSPSRPTGHHVPDLLRCSASMTAAGTAAHIEADQTSDSATAASTADARVHAARKTSNHVDPACHAVTTAGGHSRSNRHSTQYAAARADGQA